MKARIREQRVRQLTRALGIGPRDVVVVVGAGGKTGTLRRLLREDPAAVATTTTHLAATGLRYGLLVEARDVADLRRVRQALEPVTPRVEVLRGSGERVRGLPDAALLPWTRGPRRRVLLEADGAAGRALKLPRAHEPAWVAAVRPRIVLVMGLGAWDQPLREVAHRPADFRRAGVRGERAATAAYGAMLRAYLERVPPHSPLCLLLPGADSLADPRVARLCRQFEAAVRRADPRRRDPGVELRTVATTALDGGTYAVRVEPARRTGAPYLAGTVGVLLAAGAGRRFAAARGSASGSKLLATWHRRTLLEHSLVTWLRAGFARLVVVVTPEDPQVAHCVRRTARRFTTPVRVVTNPRPHRGLGSSVVCAMGAVPRGFDVCFGAADMPALRVPTLRHLVELGAAARRKIVVPECAGTPTNPCWFPAELHDALSRLHPAEGGRQIAARHPEHVLRVPVDDTREFVDIDHPRDLERLEDRQHGHG